MGSSLDRPFLLALSKHFSEQYLLHSLVDRNVLVTTIRACPRVLPHRSQLSILVAPLSDLGTLDLNSLVTIIPPVPPSLSHAFASGAVFTGWALLG